MQDDYEAKVKQDVAGLASAVLQSRQDPLLQLPLPLLELINIFLDSLSDPSTSPEAKQLVLKALRTSIAKEHSAHSRLLKAAVPLLLDSSLPLRIHATSLLIPVVSTSPTSLISSHFPTLVSTLSCTLASFHSMTTSPHSLRFTSLSLRLLNAALLKLSTSPLAPDHINAIISIISPWIYFTRSGPTNGAAGPSAPPDRLGRSSAPSATALSFGAMGAFLPTAPSKKTSLSRSSSRTSMRSVASSSMGYGSGSEDDSSPSTPETRTASTQIRIDALSVLRTLAASQSKALYSRWDVFLSDSAYVRSKPTLIGLVESDPSTEVKLKAASALEILLRGSGAYLAIAEDRPTKASFTSLSAKLGALLTEAHVKLASLLSSPVGASSEELLLALLALCETLGKNSPYARLRQRPLALGLVKAVMPQFGHRDPTVALAAISALIALTRNELLGTPTTLDLASIARQCTTLLQRSENESIAAKLWSLLAVIAPHTHLDDLHPGIDSLVSILSNSSTPPVTEQIDFYSSLFSSNSTLLPPSSFDECLIDLVRIALGHPTPTIKLATAQILSTDRLLLLLLSSSRPAQIDVISSCLHLTQPNADASLNEEEVIAASCRSLGLLIKSPHLDPPATTRLQEILPYLIEQYQSSSSDRIQSMASWAFANTCDVLPRSLPLRVEDLFDLALELTRSIGGNESIRVNGVRSIGSLVLNLDSKEMGERIDRATKVLIDVLEDETVGAKIKWNAATASTNVLLALDRIERGEQMRKRMIEALLRTLEDPEQEVAERNKKVHYKVRIQAVRALRSSHRHLLLVPGSKHVLERAMGGLDEVRGKERGHAEGLKAELDGLLKQLNT